MVPLPKTDPVEPLAKVESGAAADTTPNTTDEDDGSLVDADVDEVGFDSDSTGSVAFSDAAAGAVAGADSAATPD